MDITCHIHKFAIMGCSSFLLHLYVFDWIFKISGEVSCGYDYKIRGYGDKITLKLEVAPRSKCLSGVEWMDGYPLDCYDY